MSKAAWLIVGALMVGGAALLYSRKPTTTNPDGGGTNPGGTDPSDLMNHVPTIHIIDTGANGSVLTVTDHSGNPIVSVPVFDNGNGSVTLNTGMGGQIDHVPLPGVGRPRRPRVGLTLQCECANGKTCSTTNSTCECCTRAVATNPYNKYVNFAKGIMR